MNIIKRDGSVAEFDRNKITLAIKKALEACDMASDTIAISVTEDVVTAIGDVPEIDQERVQDLVEDTLMKRGLLKVAKAYIKYRYRHAMVRNSNTELINGALDKLAAKHVVNQNANVDEASFGGRIGEASSFINKRLALDFKMSELAKNNHENNTIYIHDLDHYIVGDHNCTSIPFDHLLANGFKTRQTDVRGAQSVNTAFQLLAVIFQLQSLNQFGGVSATHLDFTMVPYVRKSFKKHFLKRAFTNFVYNISDESNLSDELNGYLSKYPVADEWFSLEPEEIKKIYKAFCAWYIKENDLQDEDFTFTSSRLDRRRRNEAYFDTEEETRQSIEAMVHNLNTLQSRSGNQLPFSSVNAGTCTLPEGRMVTELLLRAYLEGTGTKHSTPIFPCFIFVLKDGINKKPGDPNYDLFRLALECTAKRLYPNYANGDWSAQKSWLKQDRDMKRDYLETLSDTDRELLTARVSQDSEAAYKLTLLIEDGKLVVDDAERPNEQFSTMGCRTANGFDINALQSYKIAIQQAISGLPITMDLLSGAQKDGRGNICPVTIILPELAMIANKDVEVFMQVLEQKIEEAWSMLLERYEWICSQPAESARFTYENHVLAGYIPEEGVRSALQHGTIVIGQLGLAEALQLLIGKDHTSPEGMELAKRIEQLFKDKISEYRQKYKLNGGVYYSPAESLCHTALKKFRDKYGVIPNVSDKEYFTNSMHVPVHKRVNAFEKADIESQLTGYSSAGCIWYFETEVNIRYNLDGLEKCILYAIDKDIPYIGVNVTNDQCQDCGYLGDIPGACPKCGSNNVMRLRRVTGYLSTTYEHFNLGKQDETLHRVKHNG